MKLKSRADRRRRRHRRVRRKIVGTAGRPRMSIMKSNRCLYVQFIDDDRGSTLASVTTLGSGTKNNVEGARALGRRAAEAARSKGIEEVVVDRGGFQFHGCVKALVQAAVDAGLRCGQVAGSDSQADGKEVS